MRTLKFPKNFYWGTATSAYQVEGGIRNDWSVRGGKYNAGIACDHYNRFEEDFDLAKKMNNNAHRFSIEWARIEPEQGKFNQKEIEHYRKVLQALKKRNLEPFITLNHYTLPIWFANKGGWEKKKNIKYFLRYVDKVTKEFSKSVSFWIVFNEPSVFIGAGYIEGNYIPLKRNIFLAWRVLSNLKLAYKRSYNVIHKNISWAKVGLANYLVYHTPFNPASFWDRFIIKIIIQLKGALFLKNNLIDYHDFIGLNYYHHDRVSFYLKPPRFFKVINENLWTNDMGWEIYPEGIYHLLKELKKYKKPIYVLENGTADADDDHRARFITEHLKWIQKAIKEGVDIRGYFYWSLLDNFEWAYGFKPKFGLIEIDYKTLKRIPRPSSKVYAEICKNNALNIE